jgi:pimeloyl-ACP methyl ester carboxylesterase
MEHPVITPLKSHLGPHFQRRTMASLVMQATLIACLALGFLSLTACTAPCSQSTTQPAAPQDSVSYQFIQRWDVAKLNQILTTDTPKFFGTKVTYTPAANAVDLYRVTYSSVVPEKGNKPITATGLLALPVVAAKSLPLVSYQHGTVFRKAQVPSIPDQSPETQLMIAQFAGQGYIVIGADYFGMGDTKQPQGFLVKESHQRACYDMLQAAQQLLKNRGLTQENLYLAGWSQGGFVTLAFSQYLEEHNTKHIAVATASAPSEGFTALSGFLMFPRPIDPDWVNSLFILTVFSFEEYYGAPGLGRSLIQDQYYQICRDFYDDKEIDYTKVPTDLKKLIRPEYFDPTYFENSTYGKLLRRVEVNRRIVQTPTRTYYGGSDEVITIGMGKLVETFQKASGSGNTKVQAISAGDDATHRFTYARAVPEWKKWFDSLNKK